MSSQIKTINIHGQEIHMWATDWQFRRSDGGDLDIDSEWNIVPPGHPILFKNDEDGHLSSQMKAWKYLSRTELVSPPRAGEDFATLYLVDDDTVWAGKYKILLETKSA